MTLAIDLQLCGRRAGKSSTLSRLGAVELLYGQHVIPPGDVGVFAIVSTNKQEAAARLTTVTAILDAIGASYKPWGEHGVRIVGRRVGVRVYAASIKGVSGFTGIFVLCDEVAKWLDSETGANPATEVLRSIRPTMQTQPNARIVLSSSPMGMLDAHYDAYEAGESALQVVATAPSWVANPTLTEEGTRADEPDERTHAREYGAIPQGEAETSLILAMLLDRAMRRLPAHPVRGLDLAPVPGHQYRAAMDPATRGNAWTLVVATRGHDGVRRVVLAREWRGSPSMPLDPRVVLAEVQTLIAPYGLRWAITDQAAVDHLRAMCPRGLYLVEQAWTSGLKAEAYEHVLRLLLGEQLELPADMQVREDLLAIRKLVTRNGVSYMLAAIHGRHADYAPALAFAVDEAVWSAKPPSEDLTEAQQAEARKRSFLEERKKRAEHERRHGRLPPTHRSRTAR